MRAISAAMAFSYAMQLPMGAVSAIAAAATVAGRSAAIAFAPPHGGYAVAVVMPFTGEQVYIIVHA
jgi:hypothetical protein